jgi:HK97 family phage major capsid protein
MAYNNLISRTDAAALSTEVVNDIMLGNLGRTPSVVLTESRRIPIATKQVRFPVLSVLPTAYWVNGDTGLKQTTEANWDNTYLNVEELAAIAPIPEAVIEDADMDIDALLRPLIVEAIGRALDQAVLFGVNKPASFPTDIVASAVAASNTVTRGTNNAAAGGIAADLNTLIGLVENDGYVPDGAVARTSLRPLLRMQVATTGENQAGVNVSQNEIWGISLRSGSDALPGGWPAAGTGSPDLIVGDWSQSIVGVRRDMDFKVLTEGVITDNTGAIVYNLPQQDMIALRVTFRVGWAVPNPINYENTASSRYPFGVLVQA